MNREKEIEEIKLIIAENLATYSKAKMPYEEALKMCALGILASGYGNVKEAVKDFADYLSDYACACCESGYDGIGAQDIQNKFKEFYGEDKENE